MDAQPLPRPDPHEQARHHLSALTDGEAADAEMGIAFDAWREDAHARQAWHTYALIGDVMRSEDLAQDADADAAFLVRLRGRLAQEPVVLAPNPVSQGFTPPTRPVVALAWRRWSAPMAMAAGVLTVAGVTVMMRGMGGAAEAPPALALSQPAAPAAPAAVSLAGAQAPSGMVLVRDAELDRYLRAHRQPARSPITLPPADDGLRQVGAVAR